MSQMLASDLNNPEFLGATNPDALLHVEFYEYEPIDQWESERKSAEEGRRVVVKKPKQDFVRIMRPGDQTSMLEVPVREVHKQRWPDKWLYYEISIGRQHGGENIPGWRIEDWTRMDGQEELKRELKFKRFYTVEQVAGASDAQIQSLGLGGMGLREEARVALREKMKREFQIDNAAKDEIIAKQGKALEELQKQVQALMESATKPSTLSVRK